MEIIQLVEQKFLQVSEKVLKVLDGEIEMETFAQQLKEDLDWLGSDIMKEALEAIDEQLRTDKENRKGLNNKQVI